MEEQQETRAVIENFIESWGQDDPGMAGCLRSLYLFLAGAGGVRLRFLPRPGVSFSLRPWCANGANREFFAIIDVIDDDPGDRWLSVCFYRDMISDPRELGEEIPGGLGGGDGYCFNVFSADAVMIAYLEKRLQEALAATAR